MKLIIDIDDNLYTRLFDNGDEYVADMRRACVAIRKGTPLDKIRAEIEEAKDKIFCTDGERQGLDVALGIIDKYRNEVSK